MEAPAKSGGTRKQRNGRDLIGRLGTFPPIRFLKRHNPLRRRNKVKLGFDQPPYEIQQLALPLRTAPLPLRRRMQLRVGRWWCEAAVVVGRMSAKIERGKTNFAGVVGRYLQRIEASACPATWEPTQAPRLMARTLRVRRVLTGLVAAQWTALVSLCMVLGMLTLRGQTWDSRAVHLCGLTIGLMSLAGMILHTWHHRLISSWRAMDLFLCGQCGELRNFSPSRPCANCGSSAAPVFPGQTPTSWTHWLCVLNTPVVTSPAMLVCLLLLGARAV